jgi:hypothetical protein
MSPPPQRIFFLFFFFFFSLYLSLSFSRTAGNGPAAHVDGDPGPHFGHKAVGDPGESAWFLKKKTHADSPWGATCDFCVSLIPSKRAAYADRVKETLPTGQLTNIQWRRQGVKYANNGARMTCLCIFVRVRVWTLKRGFMHSNNCMVILPLLTQYSLRDLHRCHRAPRRRRRSQRHHHRRRDRGVCVFVCLCVCVCVSADARIQHMKH